MGSLVAMILLKRLGGRQADFVESGGLDFLLSVSICEGCTKFREVSALGFLSPALNKLLPSSNWSIKDP